MRLGILNTSIATEDGLYRLSSISLEEARRLVNESEELDSAVGHEATAQILSALLGVEILVNRQKFSQQAGQKALVFKLLNPNRLPEGRILSLEEIEEVGYKFQVLTRQHTERTWDEDVVWAQCEECGAWTPRGAKF